MKKHLSAFLSGVLTAALLFSLGTAALAAAGKLTLEVDPIGIRVNGEIFEPKDAKGGDVPVFAYNGTTYAPLRALAEAYGLTVGYDAEANMATVTSPQAPAVPVPARDAVRGSSVTVHTAGELLAAIAPDTEVVLAPGEYNLTELAYKTDNPYVVWFEEYDGPQLNVVGVDGLTLRGQDAAKTNILITPRYADVLHFEGCSDLMLDALTIGHTPTGTCQGSVLNFENTQGIRISGCDLYGCGTYGIEARTAQQLLVEKTTIRDCSYGAVVVTDSAYITFDGCDVHDNMAYTLMSLYNSRNVSIVNTTVRSNQSASEYYPALLASDRCMYVAIRNCSFQNNEFSTFCENGSEGMAITVENCTYEANGFSPPAA